MQHKLSPEWSHDIVWYRIQKLIFWSMGTLTTIYGEWGLGPLQGVPTQLFYLICVLHWKWPFLNWWPKKFFPNILSPYFRSLGNFPLSKQDWKINFRSLQMEVSHILIIRVLIISCSWALFESRFLIIFRISSVEKSIVVRNSCVFFCESHWKFTVITYNRTLVSKEIIENIGFFFEVSYKFVLV